MAIVARFGAKSVETRLSACTAAEAVGDFVYIVDNPVGGKDQVRKADPSTYDKMPAVGVIVEKPDLSTCWVQWLGETPAIFSGLAAGRLYFIGTDSRISGSPPAPIGRDMFIQVVAVAVSNDRAYIRPEGTLIRRKAV